MFTTRPENAATNLKVSETIEAAPARMRTPEGDVLEAVAIFTGRRVTVVLTTEAARRLAFEIADALEVHTREKPVKRDTATNDHFAGLADR
ncbi:hypothetical protein GCM10011374_03270 [Kocuria dechangensis]|uniref:Uncharacterized protein n=1 Tax=Kocuria dechangensis TaxID=1176249 RepID=A0A917GGN9_9MICC|nr:hypothetical protein [Kocuria dechangensis]GGG44300.1 hypothetical protein GCM10011374_03270 [Kocuria dechangensis]